jgi:hypothetical protein
LIQPDVAAHEAGGSQVQDQPELCNEFEVSLGTIARSYLQEKKKLNTVFKHHPRKKMAQVLD